MRDPVTAYIALGANLGDAVVTVRHAIEAIGRLNHTHLLRCSSLYRSAPIDSSGPDYINAVIEISTASSAPELLLQMQHIERRAGRERPYRNAPRTLDLDILLFGSAHISSAALTVPHPRMNQRAFVLVPLAQVAPELVGREVLHAVSRQPCHVVAASGTFGQG